MYIALRTLAGILIGIIVTIVLVVAVEFLSSVVHPFPEDFGGSEEEVCQHVERCPHWVLAMAVAAWTIAAFAGAWTAQRLGNLCSFAVVSLLVLAALVMNLSMLPYPIWFKIATLLAIPIAMAAGGRLATRNKTEGAGGSK